MLLNSEPSPRHSDRCWPTRPTGCGTGADVSNIDGIGDVVSTPSPKAGDRARNPSHAPLAVTVAGPTTRRPQRVERTGRRAVKWPSAWVIAVEPLSGSTSTNDGVVTTTYALSTRSRDSSQTVHDVVSPSRTIIVAHRMSEAGRSTGRHHADHTAIARRGPVSTTRSGRPNATATIDPPAPIKVARTRAYVGRHRPSAVTGPHLRGTH